MLRHQALRSLIALSATLFAATLFAGCGDDAGGAPDAGPPDASGDASSDGAADATVDAPPIDVGPTVDYEVEVQDLLSGSAVRTGVVCVNEVPGLCADIDDMGMATLPVPVDSEIQVRVEATRYMRWLYTLRTTMETRNLGIDVGKTSNIAPLVSVAGVTLDREKGHVAFIAQTESFDGVGGVAGVTDPVAGEGPIYLNADSIPDETLVATVEGAGLGVIANIDPGDLELVYTTPAGTTCVPRDAWPGTGDDRLRMHIEANTLTFVSLLCTVEGSIMDGGVGDGGAGDADTGDAGTGDAGADAGDGG